MEASEGFSVSSHSILRATRNCFFSRSPSPLRPTNLAQTILVTLVASPCSPTMALRATPRGRDGAARAHGIACFVLLAATAAAATPSNASRVAASTPAPRPIDPKLLAAASGLSPEAARVFLSRAAAAPPPSAPLIAAARRASNISANASLPLLEPVGTGATQATLPRARSTAVSSRIALPYAACSVTLTVTPGAGAAACSPVTLTAVVTKPGGAPAEGYIIFAADGAGLSPALRLTGGSANVTVTSLLPGVRALTAWYLRGESGTCNEGPSAPLAYPVSKTTPVVTVVPRPANLTAPACSMKAVKFDVTVGAAGGARDCATPGGVVGLYLVRGALPSVAAWSGLPSTPGAAQRRAAIKARVVNGLAEKLGAVASGGGGGTSKASGVGAMLAKLGGGLSFQQRSGGSAAATAATPSASTLPGLSLTPDGGVQIDFGRAASDVASTAALAAATGGGGGGPASTDPESADLAAATLAEAADLTAAEGQPLGGVSEASGGGAPVAATVATPAATPPPAPASTRPPSLTLVPASPPPQTPPHASPSHAAAAATDALTGATPPAAPRPALPALPPPFFGRRSLTGLTDDVAAAAARARGAVASDPLLHRVLGVGVLLPMELLPGTPSHALMAGGAAAGVAFPGTYTVVAQYSGDKRFEKGAGAVPFVIDASCPPA